MDGYIVIERQRHPPQPPLIKGGIRLRNCIVLPGSKFFFPHSFENCILGSGFKIDLKESEMLGEIPGVTPFLSEPAVLTYNITVSEKTMVRLSLCNAGKITLIFGDKWNHAIFQKA